MNHNILRSLLIAALVLAVVGLLAYARGEPGDDGRSPDAPAASVALHHGATPGNGMV